MEKRIKLKEKKKERRNDEKKEDLEMRKTLRTAQEMMEENLGEKEENWVGEREGAGEDKGAGRGVVEEA